ncbi:MAG: protein LonB [Acidobacteria bacterium]|nr:MAG: protein LonB [Acidobacteriota bacterium]
MQSKFRLKPSQLKRKISQGELNFSKTTEVKPLEGVIGQERAVQAIEFGLNMNASGYNIFVTGIEGTGKSTIVNKLVKKNAARQDISTDWCMVNNFKDSYKPKVIALPAGEAAGFSKTMAKLIRNLRIELPKAFQDATFQDRQRQIQEQYNDKQRVIYTRLEEMAARKDMRLQKTPVGFQSIPLVNGKPLTQKDFAELSDQQKQKIQKDTDEFRKEMEIAFPELNRLNRELRLELDKLFQEVSNMVIDASFRRLRKHFSKCETVLHFLDEVKTDLLENLGAFINQDEKSKSDQQENDGDSPQPPVDFFKRYQVNLLVDRTGEKGAPVVFETNPTYVNLFGQIEKRAFMGTLTTDFTMVQAGSMLQANGGYLILEILSVLQNPFVWDSLKRALQNKELKIEDTPAMMGFGTASLRPQPIPLDVKVVLLGSYHLFHLLQNHDPKFNKIFKIRADFDHEVKLTAQTLKQYSAFIARVCKEEALNPLTVQAVTKVIEWTDSSKKSKLSLKFGPVMAILREAHYWSVKEGAQLVDENHVAKAIAEHRFRYNLYEEKVQESYTDESLLVDVDGAVTGQINGLAVYQIGDLKFGRPSRITAETFMGKHGIVNIERESKLSGKTHDKGVLILSGYLGRTFAQNYPLSVSISITFEQNYGGVDGDSASSTELYAILSSLSGIPLKQGIAVTGSVNQKGEIQPIGGVNEKIEGFYEVCKVKGLTGSQGVMIPAKNVQNLSLNDEVIEAVEKKQFHIYAITTVEEGMQVLTGVKTGRRTKTGLFTVNSTFYKVEDKLKHFLRRGYQLKKEFEAERKPRTGKKTAVRKDT